jgi:ATP/maltotriose-dependent transcriptional regulator MalT
VLIWATGAASVAGDPMALAQVAGLAGKIASSDADDESMYVAQALAGVSRAMEEDGGARADDLEEALAWASTSDDAQHVFAVSVAALFSGHDQRFATLINRAISLARTRGEFGVLAEALTIRAAGLQMAHRFDEAALAAGEAEEFARELGAINAAARPLSILAFVAAVHGDEEEAHRRADELLELAAAHGLPLISANAVYALAILDLGHGRWAEALERLEELVDAGHDAVVTILTKFALPNMVEAATRAGDLNKARRSLSAFENWAGSSGEAWARPILATCRALVAEGDEATEHFEEALRLASDARPFDLARIELLYGEHLRRERRRTDSRVHLRAALEAFERFRAAAWAERARTELRASGETARKRDPSTIDQLTPQELQIARFVADGLSNKEVAAQLFLSPRTIDYHLRNVFAKLGIKSRTQLARFPLDGGDQAQARAVAVSV